MHGLMLLISPHEATLVLVFKVPPVWQITRVLNAPTLEMYIWHLIKDGHSFMEASNHPTNQLVVVLKLKVVRRFRIFGINSFYVIEEV